MIYKNSTDLLIDAAESAKMQRDAGIKEPVYKLDNIKFFMPIEVIEYSDLMHDRTFPIGVVEGKAVCDGDIVYKQDGTCLTVRPTWKGIALWSSYTLTKPKTVRIEIPYSAANMMIAGGAEAIVNLLKAAMEKENESH